MEFLMQPIRRSTVMEEVNDNQLPMEPVHYPAVATATEELSPMATVSVDGQICAADVAVGAEGDDEPQVYEQSARLIQKHQAGLAAIDTQSGTNELVISRAVAQDVGPLSDPWVRIIADPRRGPSFGGGDSTT